MLERSLGALLVAGALLAACGEETSAADYRREADAACAEARRGFDRLGRSRADPAQVGDRAAELTDRLVERLLDPDPPGGLREQQERLRGLIEDSRARAERIQDDPSGREREALMRSSRRIERLFREMGIARCTRAFGG